MFMKQDNRNSISVIQRNLDESLIVNPIENGNDPTSSEQQGYMYTSEISKDNSEDDYALAYGGMVVSIFSKKTSTGNNDYFELKVFYSCYNEPVTDAAVFGNNLIKAGDAFSLRAFPPTPVPFDDIVLQSPPFNYVKGSVIKVVSIDETGDSPYLNYTYTIICSIAEGLSNNLPQYQFETPVFFFDPPILITNIQFLTNRRMFKSNNANVPINLDSSITKIIYDNDDRYNINFYWDDPTNTAVSYKLMIRNAIDPRDQYILPVNGNSLEFNAKITPLLFKTDPFPGYVSAFKIEDPGYGYALPEVRLNTTAFPGAPFSGFGVTDNCGSLYLSDCVILQYTIIDSKSISVIVRAVSGLGIAVPRIYVDFGMNVGGVVTEFVEFLTEDNETQEIIIMFDDYYDISSMNLINKKITLHSLFFIPTPIVNNKLPLITYDKYNANTKYALSVDAENGLLAPGNYYWSVASIFDCNQKSFSEWSQEELLIIS